MKFSELHRLQPLQFDLALLPVGWGSECKGPMLKAWPDHPGHSTEQLQNFSGIRSVGARTGALTGPLLAFDFDGESSIKYACSKGLDPWSVTTWQVHRDNDICYACAIPRWTYAGHNVLSGPLFLTCKIQRKSISH